MELLRLSAPLAQSERLSGFINEQDLTVLLDCVNADTVIVAGAFRDQWAKPLGVWLSVSPDYPAQLAARDVATLSWLIELDHVVIAARDAAEAHAEVVRALLTNDEVNFSNEVVNLVKAYNRPAPPRGVRVWSYDGAALREGADSLGARSATSVPVGELTVFASS